MTLKMTWNHKEIRYYLISSGRNPLAIQQKCTLSGHFLATTARCWPTRVGTVQISKSTQTGTPSRVGSGISTRIQWILFRSYPVTLCPASNVYLLKSLSACSLTCFLKLYFPLATLHLFPPFPPPPFMFHKSSIICHFIGLGRQDTRSNRCGDHAADVWRT